MALLILFEVKLSNLTCYIA